MDDRSTNALKHVDPFAATDALLSGEVPGEALFVINLCAANMPQAVDASSVRSWGVPGLEAYKLYQVSRQEDGRTRYRVRLGFFTSEADAEAVLRSIRGKFATAFTSGLCDEDLKHASGYLKKPLQEIQEISDTQRTGRYRIPKFAPEDLPPNTGQTGRQAILKSAPPIQPVSRSIARAASAMLDTGKPVVTRPVEKSREEVVEFEWAPESKAGTTLPKSAAPPKANVRNLVGAVGSVGRPVNGSVRDLLAKSAPANHQVIANPASAQSAAKTGATNPVAARAAAGQPAMHAAPKVSPSKPSNAQLTAAVPPISKASATTRHQGEPFHVGAGQSIPDHGLSLTSDTAVASKAAPQPASKPSDLPRPLVSAQALSKLRAAAAQPRNTSSVIPTLDTTQTIRVLTKTEIEDATAPKWFVVQLAISPQPANLDTMPRLDIFEAYRLYSVAVMDNNIIRHALRLGFFSEQVSAEAVLGYLKTFFADPTIERISDAEQKRFGESFALNEVTEPPKSAAVVPLETKRPGKPHAAAPSSNSVRPAASSPMKSATKFAAPAIKRSPPLANKKGGARPGYGKAVSKRELDEARMLGLSDTAIRRVERNPSLLSRLVDKLTK